MHPFFASNARPHGAPTGLTSADHFLAHSPGLMCIAGFDGFFKMLNPAWEPMLGFSNYELCAAPFLSFVHPDDRPRAEHDFTQLQRPLASARAHTRFRCKDGSYRWLTWSATHADDGCIYASACDVTKRVQLEEKLRASNEALENKLRSALMSNRELIQLGQFKDVTASMIVHDLKAPLAIILMNHNFVVEGFEGDPECLSALKDSQSAGRRMLTLLANLNDISRFERGVTEPKRALTTVAALVMPLTEQRRVVAKSRGISILQVHSDDVELSIDSDLITRVLENIFDNALRYTPANGRIEIEVRDLGDEVELRIGNSGVPIAEAIRESIFEKFGQASGSDTGRMNVGLGLYFSRLSVEAHQGRIWVEQTQSLPTVFVIRLPKQAKV